MNFNPDPNKKAQDIIFVGRKLPNFTKLYT